MELNLTRENADKFQNDYGSWMILASLLTEFELTQLQAMNHLAYRTTVPRVQSRLPVTDFMYFTSSSYTEIKTLFRVNAVTNELDKIEN